MEGTLYIPKSYIKGIAEAMLRMLEDNRYERAMWSIPERKLEIDKAPEMKFTLENTYKGVILQCKQAT